LILNFAELVVAFGILYLQSGSIKGPDAVLLTCPLDALYFSATTMLTVGYGDFTPCSHFGRLLVLGQFVCVGLFVLLMLPLILSAFSPSVNSNPS